MNTVSVKGILKGIKTQTRRIANPQPGCGVKDFYHRPDGLWQPLHLPKGVGVGIGLPIKCPYEIGQTVWVRETFSKYKETILTTDLAGRETAIITDKYIYKANDPIHKNEIVKWKPSRYMPRKAARLFLKITNIRIERIQEITPEDVEKEGVIIDYDYPLIGPCDADIQLRASEPFKELWDSINKKRGYGWDENPYVWVYDFEIINGGKK